MLAFFTGMFASQGTKGVAIRFHKVFHSLSFNPLGAVWEPWQFTSALRRVKCLSCTFHHNHCELNNSIYYVCVCARMSLILRLIHLRAQIGSLSVILICTDPITQNIQMVQRYAHYNMAEDAVSVRNSIVNCDWKDMDLAK